MLILFSAQFQRSVNLLLSDPVFRDCVDNLSIAHRKGTHLISGPAHVLRTLSDSLQGDAAGTFRVMRQQRFDIATFRTYLCTYVVIDPRRNGDVLQEKVGRQTLFHAPYGFFARYDSVQPVRLVCEDADDKNLLKAALKAFLFIEKGLYHGLSYALQGFGGGGSSIADQFRDQSEQGPTLAVVDSDRDYPEGNLGSTAHAALRMEVQIGRHSVAAVEVLQVRELENMIPRSLVEMCLVQTDGAEARRRVLELCEKNLFNGKLAVRYLDLKTGFKRRHFLECAAQDKKR